MEQLDTNTGDEEPDFLGLNAEKFRLYEIIGQQNSNDKNYFL